MNPDDPNLQVMDMKVIAAMLQHGTVTAAAARLGVTQSALSYTLERMRRRFADPLFVRVGNRMAATPFAEKLGVASGRVLRVMETEFGGLAAFDPATTTREYRIAVNETGAINLIPKLVQHLAAAAPHARLSPVHADPATLAAALESGEIDLAAGPFFDLDNRLHQQLLYVRQYACIARRDHPRIGSDMSLEAFSQAPLIRIDSSSVIHARLDAQLEKKGLRANVAMTLVHTTSVPFIVAASDLIAVIPLGLVELFAPIAAIKVVRLPLVLPSIEIRQFWHPRVASDPALRFLRTLVYDSMRDR